MNWSASEIRMLRYRMGWSQAEMARFMSLDSETIASWETGRAVPAQDHKGLLFQILQTAEAAADNTQRRPVAEVAMKSRNLSQIHNLELLRDDSSEKSH